MSRRHRLLSGTPLPRRVPQRSRATGRNHPATLKREHGHIKDIEAAVVDCALYASGERASGTLPLQDAFEESLCETDRFVWIGLHDPAPKAMEAVAEHFELSPLVVEDAVHAHQRPKLETIGDLVFVVFKTARYIDASELVEIGELMVIMGPSFVVTVRHGDAAPLAGVRADLEAHPDLLAVGPSAVLYAVADRIVDDYEVVLEGLANDIDEVEDQVFSGDGRDNPAQRIYKLKREVLEFKRAVGALVDPIQQLAHGRVEAVDKRTIEYFSDVRDHLLRDAERVQGFDELLSGVLAANIAQLSMADNRDMRKISAWVAILAVPTMVFGLYGMNFEHMPELRTQYGYPIVLAVTAVLCAILWSRFRRSGWL